MDFGNIEIKSAKISCDDIQLMNLGEDIPLIDLSETKITDETSVILKLNFNKFDPNNFTNTLGIDIEKFPHECDIQYQVLVQNRKHKKKRINKKWIKRYGYRAKDRDTKGWQINAYTDGSFEFKKDCSKEEFINMTK